MTPMHRDTPMEQTMATAEHTPGPWEAVEATEHHGFYVTDAFGNTVCDLYTMSRPDMLSTANGGPSKPVPFMHEMAGPNARLTASAPELLDAALNLLGLFDNAVYRRRLAEDALYHEAIAQARTAVAKALPAEGAR